MAPPISGKRLPRLPFGTMVPRATKAVLDQVQQVSRVGGGSGVMWMPGGPQFMDPIEPFRLGVTPSGGIPAFDGTTLSSATIQSAYILLDQSDTTQATWNQDASSSFLGFNLSSDAVAGNANTIYLWFADIWICIWEDCNTSS